MAEKKPDPAKITEEALGEAALSYLDKRDASVSQVRQVLHKRIAKYGEEGALEAAREPVERLLRRLVESRVLDDVRYVRTFGAGQRRRGASLQKIRAKLRARGIADSDVVLGLQDFEESEELSEEASALLYAQKRRLRERYNLDDPKERQKALAALARQGFSFEMAKKALGL